MNLDNIERETNHKADQIIDRFNDGLKALSTGRANKAMLDGVKVEAYGTIMPINQLASIMVTEAQLLQINPFDTTNLEAIVRAIRNDNSLGLNPTDDGRLIRVPIPPLNEERRRELAKQIGLKQEETMIAIRNARHEAMDLIDKAKKDKSLGEDEAKRLEDKIEAIINKARQSIERAAKDKEAEILTL